jgi:hypothetical protein
MKWLKDFFAGLYVGVLLVIELIREQFGRRK